MWIRLAVTIAFTCIAQAASAPSIAIFVDFENQPSVASVTEMKMEVAAILEPAGLSLNWRSLNDRGAGESFPDLVVLKFRGSCQVRNPSMDSELGPAVEGQSLASTMVSDGHVLPFTDVKCNEVRRFLAPELLRIASPKRDAIYGKALGRVVAHELYHILAETEVHGTDGVARSSHTRRDLTAEQFRFTPKETATLHDVKWRALLAGEGEAVSWQLTHP